MCLDSAATASHLIASPNSVGVCLLPCATAHFPNLSSPSLCLYSQYDTDTVREGSKNAGECVNRSKSWASAMRNVADNTATALKAFYRGPWACTNTWQGNGCSGNLEGTHNTWHQAVGGDVVWLAWATFDPLFW